MYTFGSKVPKKIRGASVNFGVVLEDSFVKEMVATSIDHIATNINIVNLTSNDIDNFKTNLSGDFL